MAGTLKVKNVQLGDNVTATQNFVWSENSDGTAKLARGNVGATTQDILTVDADGRVAMPQNINTQIGVGQTWQNVIGSRSSGTTYTNDTEKPIQVSVSSGGTGLAATLTLTVDGILVAQSYAPSVASNTVRCFVTAVIPAGSTYVAAFTGGAISAWAELR